MKIKQHSVIFIILQSISTCYSILHIENGKDLPNNFNDNDLESRIRRPFAGGSGAAGSGCNFNGIKGGRPKTDPTGRFFFDLNYVDVNYNHILNVNCGGGDSHPGGGGINKPTIGGNKPILGGHKPILGGHKPILGGHKPIHGGNKPILGGNNEGGEHQEGLFANRPFLSLLFGDRPLQGLLGQADSQSQSQSGVLTQAISGVTSLLPTPEDVGQGLGQGISSFFQTIPQIGQSFQSLLPTFDNFQFPSLPSSPSSPQGPTNPSAGSVSQVVQTPATTANPDMIYNDDIKPVHEDPDPVTDPYNSINKLPPGTSSREAQNRYQVNRRYQNQMIFYNANRNNYDYQRYPQNEQPRALYRQEDSTYEQYQGRSSFNEDRAESKRIRFPS